jgi:hypothetical protein
MTMNENRAQIVDDSLLTDLKKQVLTGSGMPIALPFDGLAIQARVDSSGKLGYTVSLTRAGKPMATLNSGWCEADDVFRVSGISGTTDLSLDLGDSHVQISAVSPV